MKTYLTDQAKKLSRHLEYLKQQPVMLYDTTKLTEKTTTIKIDTLKKFQQLNSDFLFDYKIFPNNIMSFLTQWTAEHWRYHRSTSIHSTI